MASRTYSKTQGTYDLKEMYGLNAEKDKTLKELGYTYQSAKDWMPAMAGYWEARGWSQADFLELYLVEACWGDALFATDTYMGVWGYYRPPSFISQSRAHIIVPDGWYRVKFGCLTALGHYEGAHPNVYSDRSGSNPGCTPGTCLEIDHANWMSSKMPQRNCITPTCWNADFGQVGGLAYTEGVIVEYFRVEGGMGGKNQDPAFKSTGIAASHPGENSVYRFNMACNFNNGGYTILGGTPGYMEANSAFYNNGPGFDMLSNNALTNMTMIVPSGDCNKGGLIHIRAVDSQSVAGGEFTIMGLKAEGRGMVQKAVICDAPMGLLSVTVNGATVASDVTLPELFEINSSKGNGQFASWEVNVNGLLQVGNANAMLTDKGTGKTYKVGGPYQPMSFVINDGGIVSASRTSDPPVSTGTGGGGVVPPVDPPVTGMTLTSAVPVGSDFAGSHPYPLAVDDKVNTYALSGRSMQVGDEYIFTFASRSVKGITLVAPAGYNNSYARKFDLMALVNGQWVKQGTTFTGAFTSTATFAAVTTTSLKFIVREANGNWLGWSNVTLQ